jgi:hypothetical protein
MEDYREKMSYLFEVVQLVVSQILERLATIPYAIRQFCKCLYQAAKLKFNVPDFFQGGIKLVAGYLFEKWMFKAIFVNPHMEGLVKDFYLTVFC